MVESADGQEDPAVSRHSFDVSTMPNKLTRFSSSVGGDLTRMCGLLWRGLTRERLDLRFDSDAVLSARIVGRPGAWMKSYELNALVDDLRTVAAHTLPRGTLTYGVFSADRSHLERAVITVLYERATGKPIAFNALALIEGELHGRSIEVTHLGLVMVAPNVRAKGLSWHLYGLTCLILFARRRFRTMWISNVTQVPAIIGRVVENFSDVFPGPNCRAKPSADHLALAKQIMKHHRRVFGVGDDAVFDESRFVIENAYTGGSDHLKKTFSEVQLHRDASYNAFCARELNYTRGDDILQLGRMDIPAVWRHLISGFGKPFAGLSQYGRFFVSILRSGGDRRQLSRC
jgi:hypothetical protein